MASRDLKKVIYDFVPPILFSAVLLLVKLVEWQFNLDFSDFGVFPRKLYGLRGVFLGPFIHGDFNHLFNNIIPLLVLGWALFYFYKDLAVKIFIWSFLLAGLYTWISARPAYHIGASGLVYALFGFLFVSGFIRKSNPLIAISFLVAFLYGSLIWGILPWDKAISWEGHFWGLFVGIVLSFYFRKQGPQAKKYEWADEEDEEEWEALNSKSENQPINYTYHFVPKKEKDKSN